MYKRQLLASHAFETIAALHSIKGRVTKARNYYDKAHAIIDAKNYKDRLPSLVSKISELYLMEGDYDQAMHYALKAKTLLKYSKSKIIYGRVNNVLGTLHTNLAQFDSAYYYNKKVFDYIDEDDINKVNNAAINLSNTFRYLYDFDKASEYLELAFENTDKSRFPLNYASTICMIGGMEKTKGNLLHAENKLSECISLLENQDHNFRRLLELSLIHI